MKYCFGDIVVVDEVQIGVVVKSWCSVNTDSQPHYEVYVRSYNHIADYDEDKINRYMVRHKYLDEQDLEWNNNAINEQ